MSQFDRRVLIDCGLQQGRDEADNSLFPFVPGEMDDLVLTHAHIDHSGRIPLLYKQGFAGNIYCTRLTARLLSIMLRDSAHIQESDAKWENQKGKRAGRPIVEPLYTLADAERALRHVVISEYEELREIGDGITIRFIDAGHLLGSASVEFFLVEGAVEKKVVFSGDIGNRNQPIIRDPQPIAQADYVITESTYGDRLHQVTQLPDYAGDLATIIDDTLGQGGNVIIPSFAVGRTQELLYFMREMKKTGRVKKVPNFQVYVDSPLAGEATRIFSGDLTGYLDEEAIEALKEGNLFEFNGLNITESSEESKGLNQDNQPKVIISASGMCDAGRIRHHLKHNLWRADSTVVFVGFQSEGSLGRRLLDGAKNVKLFGEEITVRAKVVKFEGLSSHADRDDLLKWIEYYTPKPQHVFIVHGDSKVTEIYAQTLRDKGFAAHAVNVEEVYDLIENRIVEEGYAPVPKQRKATEESASFRRLESVGEKLQQMIQGKKGSTNKDLERLARQLQTFLDKWDK